MKTYTISRFKAARGIKLFYDKGFGLTDVVVGKNPGKRARAPLSAELARSIKWPRKRQAVRPRLKSADIAMNADGGGYELVRETDPDDDRVLVLVEGTATSTLCSTEIEFGSPIDPQIIAIGEYVRRRGGRRTYRQPEVLAVICPDTTIRIRNSAVVPPGIDQKIAEAVAVWDGSDFLIGQFGFPTWGSQLPDSHDPDELLIEDLLLSLHT